MVRIIQLMLMVNFSDNLLSNKKRHDPGDHAFIVNY
jgi:hypothetical protein